jgi:hypothetical protein
MVRVLGNSIERVPVPDLNDVIYYRQIKEYTDQEYEASRDLRKELARGRLTELSRVPTVRGNVSEPVGKTDISAEIKAAVREAFSGQGPSDMRSVARELAPIIAEIVRQEVAKIPSSGSPVSQNTAPTRTSFVSPEYVPTISTEGMIGNIEAHQTQTSGTAADEALKALRAMKK